MTGLDILMSNLMPPLHALDRADDGATPTISDQRIHAKTYAADHVLFSAGDDRDNAYLIDQGEVIIKDAADQEICRLGPGDFFGEMALIEGGQRSATAVTSVLTDVFVIPRAALKDRVRGLDPILTLLIGFLIERYRSAHISLPESIQQEQAGRLSQTLNGHDDKTSLLSDDLTSLSNIHHQRAAALTELKLEQDVRRGLQRAEFIPVLQPILSLPDRRVVGFEALIRWYHPEKGLIFPDNFIPVAERTGVVQLLDKMMMQKACRLIPEFLRNAPRLPDDFFISVNLSGTNFETLDVIHDVREALIESDVDPRHLKLEITESALISDPKRAEQVLHGLRALGVTIALDDFGTGYSSLGYLHKFPIDSLKIDRSFVRAIHDSSKSLEIVNAIVGLARNFKLGIIAEGIETEQDAAVIGSLGCEMAQGYLFGKPMSSDDAQRFIQVNLSSGF